MARGHLPPRRRDKGQRPRTAARIEVQVVRARTRSLWGRWLGVVARRRRVRTTATFGLVVLGPLLAAATFLMLGPLARGATSPALRLTLLADLVYVLVVAALVFQRVARMVAERRAHSAGSRLHMRLSVVFAIVALVPTVLVAIFATLTVNVGLEGWFSDRVRRVVGASLEAAEAYEGEHRRDLAEDAGALARYLNRAERNTVFLADGDLRQLLTNGQAQIQRGLKEAYVIDGGGELRARGERSYLFDYERPEAEAFARARAGETVIAEDWDANEFRALVALNAFTDRFLLVSRRVDGELLSLLDDTQATARFYRQLESERGRLIFEFGLIYLGFALILILAAVWMGLWFAERLARPVGRLASAAERVGGGDLDVQVPASRGDDEIAMLGGVFNQMTRQLKSQRRALLKTHEATDRQRRLFDSVLSSVTAGVVGLDPEGRVSFVNRAAHRLLGLSGDDQPAGALGDAIPEFAPLFRRLRGRASEVAQEEIKLARGGKTENLLVRMATRRAGSGELEGYVVAFDDVTDLVVAQRQAAWGDVARKIAHEIKNPLTPIQLSAERLRRKFRPKAEGADAEALESMTDVIVRQTADLRRIVDEFSQFARMPEADRKRHDLTELVRDAAVLQDGASGGVSVATVLPEEPLMADVDATMISQALTNLIKNGEEATETLRERGAPEDYAPAVEVSLAAEGAAAVIRITDNGPGLPADRARLLEPYVTTRDKGTGLGLPIVKKIAEEHGGTLELRDAAPRPGAPTGAVAEMRLSLAAPAMAAAE